MSILINDFLTILAGLAPDNLAEKWDNVGLQLGNRFDSVDVVMVALDATESVLDEADANRCGLVLTHHPLIFPPFNSASDDTVAGRVIRSASRRGIALVAAHTNLDAASGGLADTLAQLLGLSRSRPLQGATNWSKLVVFVPASDIDIVKRAIFAAGAGDIGNYRHCSFMVEGTGAFLPREGARPAIGAVGREEQVPECRLEAVFPSQKAFQVQNALLAAHSYEEPAYDIYPLVSERQDAGLGRVGELATELELAELAATVAELFGLEQARFSGSADTPVRRVAVVPGSGASLIGQAIRATDVLVTGDFKYHDVLRAAEHGLALIDIPHEISESVALENWVPHLQRAVAGHGVKVRFSTPAAGLWRAAPRRGKAAIPDVEENSMFHLHVDGGARGNPGPAGIGAILASPAGGTVETLANFIGKATNNVAEYQALISGVEMALDRNIRRLVIFSDSELIVRQLQGRYQVKNEGLKPYFQQAKSLLARLEEFELKNVPRESNAAADRLVNRALDEAGQ